MDEVTAVDSSVASRAVRCCTPRIIVVSKLMAKRCAARRKRGGGRCRSPGQPGAKVTAAEAPAERVASSVGPQHIAHLALAALPLCSASPYFRVFSSVWSLLAQLAIAVWPLVVCAQLHPAPCSRPGTCQVKNKSNRRHRAQRQQEQSQRDTGKDVLKGQHSGDHSTCVPTGRVCLSHVLQGAALAHTVAVVCVALMCGGGMEGGASSVCQLARTAIHWQSLFLLLLLLLGIVLVSLGPSRAGPLLVLAAAVGGSVAAMLPSVVRRVALQGVEHSRALAVQLFGRGRSHSALPAPPSACGDGSCTSEGGPPLLPLPVALANNAKASRARQEPCTRTAVHHTVKNPTSLGGPAAAGCGALPAAARAEYASTGPAEERPTARCAGSYNGVLPMGQDSDFSMAWVRTVSDMTQESWLPACSFPMAGLSDFSDVRGGSCSTGRSGSRNPNEPFSAPAPAEIAAYGKAAAAEDIGAAAEWRAAGPVVAVPPAAVVVAAGSTATPVLYTRRQHRGFGLERHTGREGAAAVLSGRGFQDAVPGPGSRAVAVGTNTPKRDRGGGDKVYHTWGIAAGAAGPLRRLDVSTSVGANATGAKAGNATSARFLFVLYESRMQHITVAFKVETPVGMSYDRAAAILATSVATGIEDALNTSTSLRFTAASGRPSSEALTHAPHMPMRSASRSSGAGGSGGAVRSGRGVKARASELGGSGSVLRLGSPAAGQGPSDRWLIHTRLVHCLRGCVEVIVKLQRGAAAQPGSSSVSAPSAFTTAAAMATSPCAVWPVVLRAGQPLLVLLESPVVELPADAAAAAQSADEATVDMEKSWGGSSASTVRPGFSDAGTCREGSQAGKNRVGATSQLYLYLDDDCDDYRAGGAVGDGDMEASVDVRVVVKQHGVVVAEVERLSVGRSRGASVSLDLSGLAEGSATVLVLPSRSPTRGVESPDTQPSPAALLCIPIAVVPPVVAEELCGLLNKMEQETASAAATGPRRTTDPRVIRARAFTYHFSVLVSDIVFLLLGCKRLVEEAEVGAARRQAEYAAYDQEATTIEVSELQLLGADLLSYLKRLGLQATLRGVLKGLMDAGGGLLFDGLDDLLRAPEPGEDTELKAEGEAGQRSGDSAVQAAAATEAEGLCTSRNPGARRLAAAVRATFLGFSEQGLEDACTDFRSRHAQPWDLTAGLFNMLLVVATTAALLVNVAGGGPHSFWGDARCFNVVFLRHFRSLPSWVPVLLALVVGCMLTPLLLFAAVVMAAVGKEGAHIFRWREQCLRVSHVACLLALYLYGNWYRNLDEQLLRTSRALASLVVVIQPVSYSVHFRAIAWCWLVDAALLALMFRDAVIGGTDDGGVGGDYSLSAAPPHCASGGTSWVGPCSCWAAWGPAAHATGSRILASMVLVMARDVGWRISFLASGPLKG
ncbi:hypothetical protein VOLCADRAFT_103730 [Volvox carteri f. nagariensis]|uniref:Uncharacterized protein n=1 Tax=Volvox carteri f. nagariensis TaxID=3068 RepID=D8TN72_VOLCA|nr:uncharacterized protein VOLCADRAFT_103730 [Volvox carteri f. nagariensis]EFJ50940.1 hypothetical protein VOLCADRAFT_103730 [Volvox carteri f. nagariensis]|eukprot:XP_002947952.1 hypothetical protein VOLCADRAFT_103730 [Volvox carteri f. nagariensis]